VTYNRRIWQTVPVDSPEGEEAMSRPGAFSWKGAGDEGAKIINKFDTEMPFLKRAAKLAKQQAEKNGFVKLLSGRRCHFEKGPEGKYEWTHKAFNRIIQGTSAEQTKRIMIALDESGYGDRLMLQVHDEVDPSVETRDQAEEMAEVMRHAVPMKVPTVVDIEVGPSWGESMFIEEKGPDGKKIKRQYVWDL
jgi:DNA polymerase I-like protein with 3'-5' exonuclease and polymerase domains